MLRRLGPYELVRPLGRGGMAEVYEGVRRGPAGARKRVVVKRIRRERQTDPRFIELFLAEARLSLTLVHKNIVPVFDFGRVGDELYLAMELVDGVDLGRALAGAQERGPALHPLLAAWVAAEVTDALDYAHRIRSQQGDGMAIVHRDLSPRNVMLSYAGEVKLLDFGIASVGDGATGITGTPAYMAPEQARGEPVGVPADVFALGLVLAEMLTGRPVYQGKSTDETLALARTGCTPRLPEEVPKALADIVARATEVDPARRFPDARALHAALDAYVVSARAEAGDAPPARQLAAWLEAVLPRATVPEAAEGAASPTFVTEERGQRTQRSMAATLAEAEPPTPAPPTPSGPPVARRPWIAVGTTLAAAGAGAVALAVWLHAQAPASPRLATTRAASPADAAVANDASGAHIIAVAPAPDASAPPDGSMPAPADHGRPAARARPPDATGVVKINARPWARVSVRDREEGCAETPCTLTLPAGPHVLRLENPVIGVTRDIKVTVLRGSTVSVAETLAR